MSFRKEHRAKSHSTNPIGHLNGEVSGVPVGIFPNDDAIVRRRRRNPAEHNNKVGSAAARYMAFGNGQPNER